MNVLSLLISSYGKAFWYTPGVIVSVFFLVNLFTNFSITHEIAVALDAYASGIAFEFMGMNSATLISLFMFTVFLIGSVFALSELQGFILARRFMGRSCKQVSAGGQG